MMVRNDRSFQVADLATGRIRQPATNGFDWPTTMLARPGGGWVCICGEWAGFGGNRPTGVDISIQISNAAGEPDPPVLLRSVRGEADPSASQAAQPELADAAAVASSDGRLAFVSWSGRRGAAGWGGGIDVVDVATATVISSTPLTFKEPEDANGQTTTRVAPQVELSPAGDLVLVSSRWWAENGQAIASSGTEHWTASFDGRTIGGLTPAGSSAGPSCEALDTGLIDEASFYVLCWIRGGGFAVEREHRDGSLIDRTPIPGTAAGPEGLPTITRQGDQLYMWDPRATALSRFDLTTAGVESATATAVVAPAGPLDAMAALGRGLGRWIAPQALAKTFLDPGLVVSPDGTRVYALGIDENGPNGESGSRGVFVFDAKTLGSLGHWTATADFVSLAISGDGRFLYVAGQPGRDAAGAEVSTGASVTVFDTRNGAV
ncbi:MAG: YncE family protein, partial [Chloroflexota bacterium]